MRIVSEDEFNAAINTKLRVSREAKDIGFVTGPGRSGAIAAVYASHIMGVPFLPYKTPFPTGVSPHIFFGKLLIIDTARESGATLRKAARYYQNCDPVTIAVFEEPPRVAFWYEATKPQRYRHEATIAGTGITCLVCGHHIVARGRVCPHA